MGFFGKTRERGRPTSSNRASSFHLFWLLPPDAEVVEASATLTVVEPPVVEELYFWALQASFADVGGEHGGAHLGLQHHPGHPRGTAANFGGYRRGGGELDGSVSPFPSARGNVNTRDFEWEPGRPYRLTIARAGEGWWSGAIDGVVLRELQCAGDRLTRLMTWSEVFAPCDAPPVAVRWSGWEAVLTTGERIGPDRLAVNYQAYTQGGCTNTTAMLDADGAGVLQRTATSREVPQGAVLPISPTRAR